MSETTNDIETLLNILEARFDPNDINILQSLIFLLSYQLEDDKYKDRINALVQRLSNQGCNCNKNPAKHFFFFIDLYEDEELVRPFLYYPRNPYLLNANFEDAFTSPRIRECFNWEL